MSLVTSELDSYEAQWREAKLPKLQAQVYRIWAKGQQALVREDWRFTLERCQVRGQVTMCHGLAAATHLFAGHAQQAEPTAKLLETEDHT